MSLQWALSREVPPDTAALGQVILAQGNVYRQIGDRFAELFPEEQQFAPLYQETGRGAISPLLLALVIVFQMLERVPDRLATEWVVSRIDWKYALHLPLTYTGFHFTDLSAFRQRLLDHQQERLVFDQLLLRLKAMGLIKSRGKMRTDSTHVLAVVQRLSQFELVTESIRVALRAAVDVAGDWVNQVVPAAFQDTYGQRQKEYGLSETELQRRLGQASHDGFWFLVQVDQSAPPAVRTLAEVAVLRRVLQQQFPGGPGGPGVGKWPMGAEVIESPHEPEARMGKKRRRTWIGYKHQITETCDEDRPHLVVDLEATGALDHDSPELAAIQARLAGLDLLPGEQHVDQGYMSGENLAKSAEAGIALLGRVLADTAGPEGFRQADFAIDEAARQATCPAGHTSTVWSESRSSAEAPPKVRLRFDAQDCQACRNFGQCTESRRGRSLTRHPYAAELAARRAEAETEAFLQKLHLRAGIEGTISETVRRHGLRWARYRGRAKLRLQGYFTAIAVNLKRLMRWWARPRPQAAKAIASQG